MLDMGFVRDVRHILDQMPKVSQIALFSATMSRAVMDISWIYQRGVVEITVEEDALNKPDIRQYRIEANGSERIMAIAHLMKKEHYEKAMVFCNTKQMADIVARKLTAAGMKADCIHGDIRQSSREQVLRAFRSGQLQILIATDVAARGLDIDGVDAIFNYEIPLETEYYVHRIGRTGRAKRAGVAYTFTSPAQETKIQEIIRFTHTDMIPLTIEV